MTENINDFFAKKDKKNKKKGSILTLDFVDSDSDSSSPSVLTDQIILATDENTEDWEIKTSKPTDFSRIRILDMKDSEFNEINQTQKEEISDSVPQSVDNSTNSWQTVEASSSVKTFSDGISFPTLREAEAAPKKKTKALDRSKFIEQCNKSGPESKNRINVDFSASSNENPKKFTGKYSVGDSSRTQNTPIDSQKSRTFQNTNAYNKTNSTEKFSGRSIGNNVNTSGSNQKIETDNIFSSLVNSK